MPVSKKKPKFKAENRGVKITRKKRDVHSEKSLERRKRMRKDELTRDSIDYSVQNGEVHGVLKTYHQVPQGFSGRMTTFQFKNPGSKRKIESICRGVYKKVTPTKSSKKKSVVKRASKKKRR